MTELLHAADLIDPPDPGVREYIGDTYRSLGNGPQALTFWQKASSLDPRNQSLASKIDQEKSKMTSNPTNSPPPVLLAPLGGFDPTPESAPSQS